MADAGVNAFDFIGRDAGPHAGAAQQDPTLGLPGLDESPKLFGEVGIVNRVAAIGAQVERRMSEAADGFQNDILKRKTGMVTGNGYFHQLNS